MPRQSGFSLIELLTVITVLGIFAAMALPGMQYLSHATKVKAASSTLYMSLLRARSEAVKHNSSVTLTPSGSDWKNGWTLTDASGNVLLTQSELKGVSISSNISTNVVYLNSGRIQGAAPSFSVIHSTKSGDTTAAVARCVSAAPNGAPYVKSTAC
jgi:type IV fimbrial biogenesis protein FimT